MLRRVFVKLKKYIYPSMASSLEAESGTKRSLESEEDSSCKKHQVEGLPNRKRKVALIIGYNGKGFYGLQINPGFRTIESEILKALLAVGVIPEGHHDFPQKMSFQRAARTDKGVSAAGNIVSLKMLLNVENLVDKINEKLPPQIKVFDCVRTTNGFNCKNHCSGRTYIYVLPTYALAPVEETYTLDYRTNDDILERMNEILEKYKGTHNFHNFTSGIKPHEGTAKRYIKQFECRLPFVKDGVEFCVISVYGQSFMLHQIRKMIGLAIAIVRGFADIDIIDLAFGYEKVQVPMAPGLGLVLEKLHYEQYNLKWASDGSHAKLDFNQLKDKMAPFKDEFIVSSIIKEEIETQSMMQWLPVLHKHTYKTESEYDGRRFPSANPRHLAKKETSPDNNEDISPDTSNTCTTESQSNDSIKGNTTGTSQCSDSANQNPVNISTNNDSDNKASLQEGNSMGTSQCSDSTNQNTDNISTSQNLDCSNINSDNVTASNDSVDTQSEKLTNATTSSS